MTNKRYITIGKAKIDIVCFAALLLMLSIQGCVKDNVYDVFSKTVISLNITDVKDVMVTKSTEASTSERYISDAFVLVFDGSAGTYLKGERVNISSNVIDNGSQTPKIATSFKFLGGEKIVVLCNTGCTFTTIPLTATSTVADIDAAFPSTGWNINQTGSNSGKGMPMSGVISSWTSTAVCQMTRAIAKIQVVLGSGIAANDITGKFTTSNTGLVYAVYNTPTSTIGNIFNTGTISTPAGMTFTNTGFTRRVAESAGAATDLQVYYMPEYGSSTLAKGTAVGLNEWHVNRPCIILNDGSNKYYRIDLYQLAGSAKQFINLTRNNHIIVTINKVKMSGYANADEALSNPGSNLEYEVTVSGESDNYTDSNGQYSVSSSKNAVTLFDGSLTPQLLDFSLNTEQTLHLTTAYIEFVNAEKTAQVAMPECFSVKKSGVAQELPVVSGKIELGTISDDVQFALKTNYTEEYKSAIAALAGCYMHIRIGNIDKYIPISVSDALTLATIYYGKANCHEVPAGVTGSYSFDVTPYTSLTYEYENTVQGDLSAPRSAAVLWSDVSASHVTGPTVVRNGVRAKLNFNCNGVPGNAVIAVYDKDDSTAADAHILWSYHIWVSDRTSVSDQSWSVINTTTKTVVKDKYKMMDRNLGATSNVIPAEGNGWDISSFGLLYQWGRKDPFVGAKSKMEQVYKTMYTPAGTTTMAVVKSTASTGTIAYSKTHPTTFISQMDGSASVTGYDWLFAARDNALWGNPNNSTTTNYYPHSKGVKTIFDPCPQGYHVPPQDVFTMMSKTSHANCGNSGFQVSDRAGWHYVDTTISAGNQLGTIGGVQFYYREEGNEGEWTYLPGAGAINRSNGGLGYVWGGSTLYWTNTNFKKDNVLAARMSFSNNSWNIIWDSGRATGQAVRCCKE
ncbi:MAG: hypothetical protein PHD11_00565 [Bacteroidales bacterium]|nr:hypothetical protein [Bacteroidales bacterium]MDD4670664.1 hypothetical protein [Bacteroidales bacterium]